MQSNIQSVDMSHVLSGCAAVSISLMTCRARPQHRPGNSKSQHDSWRVELHIYVQNFFVPERKLMLKVDLAKRSSWHRKT